ncbi:hypothetical protein [Flaviaesturariibacter amylovorans]|uniref:DUF4468 domain-containing protein n=1 Tax=Flaviaesturariibacter amylovorans TaxID=1084520 RepID=A0ABP8GJF3_9BACT
MKPWLTSFVVVLFSLNAFATGQYPDRFIHEGTEYSLDIYPLEEYFHQHPEKRLPDTISNSGLARGYIATYEIIEGQLFLTDIQVQKYRPNLIGAAEFTWVSALKTVFPGAARVKVDWFTGLLDLSFGARLFEEKGDPDPYFYYQYYLVLEIDKGDYRKEKCFTFPEFRVFVEQQREAFKKTPGYANLKKEVDATVLGYVQGRHGPISRNILRYLPRILED